MHLEPVEQVSRIAGTMQTSMRHALEWRCPDCDYFEEVDGQLENLSPELRSALPRIDQTFDSVLRCIHGLRMQERAC